MQVGEHLQASPRSSWRGPACLLQGPTRPGRPPSCCCRNYKSKSAEALSPWFLAEWLLGDTFNLLGGERGRVAWCSRPHKLHGVCPAAPPPAGPALSRSASRTRASHPAAALLKGDQLPTVVFTAQYFICVDAGERQGRRCCWAPACLPACLWGLLCIPTTLN